MEMVVGIGVIVFRLHDCRSLKAKRSVVRTLKNKIKNEFNVSIAEVGANDIYQRAELGFAVVGNERTAINAKIDHIFNMAENLHLAEIIETDMEIINI